MNTLDLNNARGVPAMTAALVIGSVGALVLIALCFKSKVHF